MPYKQTVTLFALVLALVLPLHVSAQTGAILRADFDPTSGRIPFPNNILFTGSADGTLNIPIPEDDPAQAALLEQLNRLDGFSTTAPIIAPFSNGVIPGSDIPLTDSPIDPASVVAGKTVRLFQVDAVNPFLERGTAEPFAVERIVSELTPNLDYIATVTGQDGKTLALVPLVPLKPKTNYLVVLTDGIRAQVGGASAVPDRTYFFARYRGDHHRPLVDENGKSNFPMLTDEQAQGIARLQPAVLSYEEAAASRGVARGTIIASWTFMTQSIDDSLQALRQASSNGLQPSVFVPTGLTTAAVIPGSPGLADIYVGALQLPYYLRAPASPSQWPLILVDFWKDADGSSPTRYSPVPVAPQDVFVPVLLTVPSPASGRARPAAGWPAVIFHHGITQNRTNVFAVADMLALRGFAAIAIDLPLHGITDTTNLFYVGAFERTFNVDLINNVTLQPPPDGRIDPSGSHFINPRSAITTRDNLRGATADLFYLMATLPSVDMDRDGWGDLDAGRIGFVGHSLGAIAGTAFVTLQDGLTAVTLANPGGGLVRMLLDGSPSFSPLIRAGLAQVGLFPGTPEYETFENAFQQMVDSGDPINYSAAAADAYPIHMIEVVGGAELPDGSISPPDQTVPNTTPNAPLSGTEPMVRIMELESVESSVVDATGVRGIVRFNQGNHSTFLSPTRDTPPGTASPAAWAEMQGETADFMASEGTTLKIVDEAVVQPAQ